MLQLSGDSRINKRDMGGVNSKINDAHRAFVTRYYGTLLRKHGLQSLLRHMPRLKHVVWTARGLGMIEERLK